MIPSSVIAFLCRSRFHETFAQVRVGLVVSFKMSRFHCRIPFSCVNFSYETCRTFIRKVLLFSSLLLRIQNEDHIFVFSPFAPNRVQKRLPDLFQHSLGVLCQLYIEGAVLTISLRPSLTYMVR